jgi:bifunctional non-homologous end joining protein LigD
MKFEGVVSKMRNAPYRSGRCEHWLKVKWWRRDRFVVVGFVPEGSSGILKLRLARRESRALIYVGRVGTGWDRQTAHAIRRALEPLARPMSPLTVPVKKRDTTWVEPRFEAEISYLATTTDGMVRQPSFKGTAPAPIMTGQQRAYFRENAGAAISIRRRQDRVEA